MKEKKYFKSNRIKTFSSPASTLSSSNSKGSYLHIHSHIQNRVHCANPPFPKCTLAICANTSRRFSSTQTRHVCPIAKFEIPRVPRPCPAIRGSFWIRSGTSLCRFMAIYRFVKSGQFVRRIVCKSHAFCTSRELNHYFFPFCFAVDGFMCDE